MISIHQKIDDKHEDNDDNDYQNDEYCFDNCEYVDTTFAFRMGSGLGLGW